MKVMQINCVYRKGSTGKLVYELHTAMQAQGIESVVCYGRGAGIEETGVYKTCGELHAKVNHLYAKCSGIPYGGCLLSTNRLLSRIKKEKPDVVHLHCINGYFVNIYRLLSCLKRSRIRTVLTLHAEFMHTGGCAHAYDCERWKSGCQTCKAWRKETGSVFFDRAHTAWKKMQAAFEGFQELTVVSVSPWLQARAEQSPILRELRHCMILNGVDTEIFRPTNAAYLREKHGLQGKKVVFHVTAAFTNDRAHNKGSCYVLELAERMPEVVFLVAAAKTADGIMLPKNVVLLGSLSDPHMLAAYYSLADASVVTSRRETYSMPVAESLCCGTPVAGFEAGGPESIALRDYSSFVPFGDVAALEKALWERLSASKAQDIAAIARVTYALQDMRNAYLRLYDERV